MVIYLKYIAAVVGKILLLPTVPFACVVVPMFYRAQPELPLYTWGGIFGTFDNPVQGDNGFITKHAPFINVTDGWRGYINRCAWMWRNPLYGYAKRVGIDYSETDTLTIKGDPAISDKYKRAGWMWATLRGSNGKLKAFEWYSVTPWSKRRNLRIRLGYKIKTDKMQQRGWARHVFTVNFFDGWG